MRQLRGSLSRLLPKGQFARSVAVMGGGTAAAYALAYAASPVITRLYSPEHFGIMGVYVSMLTIAMVLVSCRYELAIPLPEEEQKAANILGLTLSLVVVISLLVGLAVWLIGDRLVEWVRAPGLRPYLWLLPLNLAVGGLYGALQIWAVRKKAFGPIAHTKLAQAVGMIVAQVGLGLLGVKPFGLLVGQVARWGTGTVGLARLAWRNSQAALRQVSANGMMEAVSRYRRFPLILMWSNLINSLSAQVPTLFLARFFGTAPAGLYALTAQVLWTPMNFIGQSISQVFFPNISEARRKGGTAGLTFRVYRQLAEIGMPYALLLAIAGPELFELVFGPAWREAGVYAQWLSPWFLFVFVSTPVSSLVYVLELQHGDLIFQVVLLAGRVAALLIGGLLHQVVVAIALYGLVSAVLWTGYMLWLLKISGNSPRAGLHCLLTNLLRAIPVGLPALAAKLTFGTPIWVVAGVVLGGGWVGVRIMRAMQRGG